MGTVPRILLLNDTSDQQNWGSVACAESLKAILLKAVPSAKIDSILSNWTTRKFKQAPWWMGGRVYSGASRLYDGVASSFEFAPAVADEFEETADAWLAGRGGPFADEFLAKARGSDAVVFNAEGSVYRMNSSAVRCLFSLWLAATRLKIPSFFLNGSVTLTVVDAVLPAMVRKTFAALAAATVREPWSLRNLSDFARDARAEMVPDSVFHFALAADPASCPDPEAIKRRLNGRPYFCLSMSLLLSMLPAYMRAGPARSALAELISALKSRGLEAVLVARDRMDLRIVSRLVEQTGALLFGPEHSYRELTALFRNAAFLVSGRYHHLIFAATVGCPAIAWKTTSHKVDGLCELLEGRIGLPFDPTDLRSARDCILHEAGKCLGWSNEQREDLAAHALRLGQKSLRLGEIVREKLSEEHR